MMHQLLSVHQLHLPRHVNYQVITHKSYDGAPADVWSCGVILFELLAGHPPFEDRNLLNLYKKVTKKEKVLSTSAIIGFITFFTFTIYMHGFMLIESILLQISIAEYKFPPWFTMSQKELLTKLLNPLPMKVYASDCKKEFC